MFDSDYEALITPFFTYSPFNSKIFDFVENNTHVWITGSKEIPTDVPIF